MRTMLFVRLTIRSNNFIAVQLVRKVPQITNRLRQTA